MPKLRSLYHRFPDVSTVKADGWAQVLDIISPPYPPSIIHRWLEWRRASDGIKSASYDSSLDEDDAAQLLTPISASPEPYGAAMLQADSEISPTNETLPLPDTAPLPRHPRPGEYYPRSAKMLPPPGSWKQGPPLAIRTSSMDTPPKTPKPFLNTLPSPVTPIQTIHDSNRPENTIRLSSSTAIILPSPMNPTPLPQVSAVASFRDFVRSRYPDGIINPPSSKPTDGEPETAFASIGAQSQAIIASMSSTSPLSSPNAPSSHDEHKA